MQTTRSYYRHARPVRVTHWVNVLALFILLLSGLQIFNAHPALYWGDRSDRDRPWLAMTARTTPMAEPQGTTHIFGRDFDTTGLFGVSRNAQGAWEPRGFPAWATIPGPRWLAMGRRWHLFFAWVLVINGLVYAAWSWSSRHLTRDLVPRAAELRGVGRSLRDHLLFRHDKSAGYNVLQKLSYLIVVFVLGPLIVLTGLSMSPWIDAIAPIADVFGGRQSARSIHFLVAFAFIAFTLVHVLMVIVTGPWNNLRGMITGWRTVRSAGENDAKNEP